MDHGPSELQRSLLMLAAQKHNAKVPVADSGKKQSRMLWTSAEDGPAPDAPSDEFSIRWSGWLKAPRPGMYRISFVGDDGVRVSIDNHIVIDDWNAHFPTRVVGEVELPAHAVPICVEYFEIGISAIASLRWNPPGTMAEELIPRECLFQREPQNSAP